MKILSLFVKLDNHPSIIMATERYALSFDNFFLRLFTALAFLFVIAIGQTQAQSIPPAPTGLSPNGSALPQGATSVTVKWNAVAGAQTYPIRVQDTTPGAAPLLYENTCGNTNLVCKDNPTASYTFPVQAGHSYKWWVHSIVSGAWSDPAYATFTVPAASTPPAPTGLLPNGTALAQGATSVTLKWNAVAGTQTYPIRVQDTTSGAAPLLYENTCGNTNLVCKDNLTTTSYSFSVQAGHSYKWWVHSIVSGAWSDAAYATFTVPAAPVNAPTISLTRTPSPMVAGQSYTTAWSSTNATSVSYNCTASGTGFAGSATLVANGSSMGTANAAWVGYPSTCTWTATGSGGSKIFIETMTTVAALAGETITYFHNDVSGTPMLATDANGNVLWKENYRPYGDKLNNQAAGSNNKLWFAGKSYDGNTGLSYMGARYYDPMLGRFMGIDPKDFDEGNIHSFNRYAYGNNNPYRFVDPDGRDAVEVVKNWWSASVSGFKSEGPLDAAHRMLSGLPVEGAALGTIGAIKGIGTEAKLAVSGAKEAGALTKAESAITQVNPKNLISQQSKSEMTGAVVKRLEKDMKANGFDQSQPISAVVREDGRLVISDGHHRAAAAIRAGIDKVPVDVFNPSK